MQTRDHDPAAAFGGYTAPAIPARDGGSGVPECHIPRERAAEARAAGWRDVPSLQDGSIPSMAGVYVILAPPRRRAP